MVRQPQVQRERCWCVRAARERCWCVRAARERCWYVLAARERCWCVLAARERCWCVRAARERCWCVRAARERCWWHQRAGRIHRLVCLRTSVSVPPSPSLSPSLSSLSSLALSLSLSRSLPLSLSFSLSLSKPSSLLSPLSSLRSPQIYLTKHVSGCQRGGAIAPPLSPLALWLSGLICSLTLFLSESVPLSPPRFGLPPPSIPEKHAAGCEILLRLGYYNPAARRFD